MGTTLAPSLRAVVATLTAETDPYLGCDDCFDRLCVHVEDLAANRAGDPLTRRHVQTCFVCGDDVRFLLELVTDSAAVAAGSGVAALGAIGPSRRPGRRPPPARSRS